MSARCLDEQTLLDFVGGTLDRAARTRVLQHLDGCTTCRAVLASLALAAREKRHAVDEPTVRTSEGVTFGRYQLLKMLGQGGMAEVFLAALTGPGGFARRCVVKRLLPGLSGDGEHRQMFLKEARVLATLEHPNLARVLDFGEVDGQLYLAMELVDGLDVHELLHRFSREKAVLPVSAALELVRQTALGLEAAHAATDESGEPLQLVHRDVSPHNLMLGRDGSVRVIDFGLARATVGEQTEAGIVKGKRQYYSPEQARGATLDARSDVFALGLVLFEVLTGKRAYPAGAGLEKAAASGAVPRENPDPARIGERVWQVYLRCVEVEPARRFASMGEVARSVEAVQKRERLGDGKRLLAALAVRSAKAMTAGERTRVG